MFYTVYKTINVLNGKFYIGKHQTQDLDDDYLGSGKLLKRAIKKHGIENFKKEFLEIHRTENEMNAAEKRLVVLGPNSYNLCEGGKGGFGYLNDGSEKHIIRTKNAAIKSNNSEKSKKAYAAVIAKHGKLSSNFHASFLGKHHSEETKMKMRASHNPASHPKGPRGPYKKRNTVPLHNDSALLLHGS